MHEICQELASARENGEVIAKDFYLRINGKDFSITVTTQKHAHLYEVPDQPEGTKVFIVEDLSDPKEICRVLSGTPFEKLQTFLVPQEKS